MSVGYLPGYEPRNLRSARFAVLGVDAIIPDHWRSHNDDLAAVRGVGEDLLISRHIRRKHDLGYYRAVGEGIAERTMKKGSVLKEEEPRA